MNLNFNILCMNKWINSLAQRMKNALSLKVFSGRIGRKRMLLLSKCDSCLRMFY